MTNAEDTKLIPFGKDYIAADNACAIAINTIENIQPDKAHGSSWQFEQLKTRIVKSIVEHRESIQTEAKNVARDRMALATTIGKISNIQDQVTKLTDEAATEKGKADELRVQVQKLVEERDEALAEVSSKSFYNDSYHQKLEAERPQMETDLKTAQETAASATAEVARLQETIKTMQQEQPDDDELSVEKKKEKILHLLKAGAVQTIPMQPPLKKPKTNDDKEEEAKPANTTPEEPVVTDDKLE